MRGQLQMSFYWMFAVGGGILFLLFFFFLIRSLLTSSDERDVRQLSFAVETIIKNALTNPDAFSIAKVRNAEYAFGCEIGVGGLVDSYVRIDKGSYSQTALRHVPLFSPKIIEGEELYTSTHLWSAPFPVSNIVVMSNNRVQYVFITENVESENLVRSFVEEENLEGFEIEYVDKFDFSSFKDEGFDQYKFIFVNTPDQNIFNPKLLKKSMILKTEVKKDFSSGLLTFYDDVNDMRVRNVAAYYGRAMLVAAIFAGDYESYTCNRAKVMARVKSSIKILQIRNQFIIDAIPPIECARFYDLANEFFDDYLSLNPDVVFRDANEERGPIVNLETANFQLFNRVCPLVY